MWAVFFLRIVVGIALAGMAGAVLAAATGFGGFVLTDRGLSRLDRWRERRRDDRDEQWADIRIGEPGWLQRSDAYYRRG